MREFSLLDRIADLLIKIASVIFTCNFTWAMMILFAPLQIRILWVIYKGYCQSSYSEKTWSVKWPKMVCYNQIGCQARPVLPGLKIIAFLMKI